MDANGRAVNRYICPVCQMEYMACERCRYFATEKCEFGQEDVRGTQAHDNRAFVRDDGGSGPSIIDLDQVAFNFKPGQHMPADCDTFSGKSTLKPN